MPANFELQIVKVQGVTADLAIVGCYVSLDGRLYDVITPLKTQAPDSLILLPNTGHLRLLLKKMSSGDDQVIGSVSFTLNLFPTVGGQFWAPLSSHTQDDAISGFTAESQGPRLLLKVTMPRMLPPVHETTETSIEDSSLDHLSHIPAGADDSKILFDDMSVVSPSNDYDKQLHELKQQVATLHQMLKIEKTQRESQENKLKTIFSEYEAAQKRMMTREKTLTAHLLEKDKELFRCIEENTELKIAARETESEMYQLQEKIRMVEAQSASAALVSTSEALEFALEQLKESEERRKELQSQVLSGLEGSETSSESSALIDDLKSQISSLQSENSDLRSKYLHSTRELQHLRDHLQSHQERCSLPASPDVKLDVEVVEALTTRSVAPNSLIDQVLEEYCEEKQVRNPFVKTGDNTYTLDGKKYSLAIRNGGIVAKIGTGFVFLEELLKSPPKPVLAPIPLLLSGGRSSSAGRERSATDTPEVRTHRKNESELFTNQSPKKAPNTTGKTVKTSTTPLKERVSSKKGGVQTVDKSRKPFR